MSCRIYCFIKQIIGPVPAANDCKRQVKLHHIHKTKALYEWLQQVYMFAMLSQPNEQSIALTGASHLVCNYMHRRYSLPSVG